MGFARWIASWFLSSFSLVSIHLYVFSNPFSRVVFGFQFRIFLTSVRSAFLPLTPCGAVGSYFFVICFPDVLIIMLASSSMVTSLSEPMFIDLL